MRVKPNDMNEKKANALEASQNASLISKSSVEVKAKTKPVTKPLVEAKKSEVIDSILNDAVVDNIYSLDSKTKKKFTIRFNNFEKAALHIVAKSENLSMLAVLEKYSLSKVLSIAVKQHRLTSDTVKILFESKKVK